MRFLTILVAVLGALYFGYWFVGSTALERGANGWLDEMRLSGWDVRYDDLNTRGFPSRFDTTLTNPDFRDPVSGIGWQAPFLQVLALSYRPNQVIAVWPPTQDIILPGETLTLQSVGLRASAAVAAAAALPLDAVTVEVGAAALISSRGWDVSIAKGLLAFRDAGLAPGQYDAFGEVTEIALPSVLLQVLDPARLMPIDVALLRLDAGISFDRPLDRFAGSEGGPRLTRITLREMRLTWGTVSVNATAELLVDAQGVPEGEISLVAANWEQMIALATNAGLIDAAAAPGFERAASAMANGSDRIDARITIENGFMAWGPVPLGPAPRFR